MDRVHLSDQSKRDLKKISFNEVKKIERQLLRLEKEPFSGKKLTGKLSGFYSLKAWPYRIIYFIKLDFED